MAFKFTVDYQNLRLVIDTDSVESVNVFQHLKSTVSFLDLKQTLLYQQLSAAEVSVDADTLNRYFTAQYNSPNAESFGFTDLEVLNVGKVLADTPIMQEQLANAMQKAVPETVQITEELTKVVSFIRNFADTPTLNETHSYAFGKGSADSFNVTETQVFATTKTLTDTYSFSDSQVLVVESALADSFNVGESFARVVVYTRTFTDTYGLDDASSVDDELATDTGVNKTNIVNVAETHAFAFTPGTIAEGVTVGEAYVSSFVPGDIAEGVSVAENYISSFVKGVVAETATISESTAFLISPVFADTATISESIDVELIKGVGPLNNSALNLNMLNA